MVVSGVEMKEPEFQIYECENPSCRFRCPNDLTHRNMERCPVCGGVFTPSGEPFTNYQGQLVRKANPGQNFEVVLDNLRSTLNVGSIFRTSDGAGISHIYCCGTTPTPKHPKIEKTGLGAEDFVGWSYCLNALDLIKTKKQDGYTILSLESTGSSISMESYKIPTATKNLLLIVGNEVSGIDPEILSLSDVTLSIPMYGKKTSLNVAVAFGIAVYALLK
jgi:tRNA G18 (ribose-2'-O)-methylase SpoU